MKKYIIGAVVLVVILFGVSYFTPAGGGGDDEILSRNGTHWHPTLAITIDGERINIPDNVGLVGGHAPIHTHTEETDIAEAGVSEEGHRPLHVEIGGVVRESDVQLGNFFEIWGEEFNSDCILNKCISEDGGSITMLVNGEENFQFEEYIMKEGDRIEVFYNSKNNTPTSADNAPDGSMHNLPVPEAVKKVKDLVASETGEPIGEVIVMSAYEKEWPNGCLGLEGEDEMCIQVIVPGYVITVQAAGEQTVYRTDSTGNVIKKEQ